MLLDDATPSFARLKAAFPTMALDEEQAELLMKEMALLHDPSVLDEAVTNLIQREDKFPPISRIRQAYRSVAEARRGFEAALRAAEPARDSEIPEWVSVWWWRNRKTESARMAANPANKGKRPEDWLALRMRPFPQCAHLADRGEVAYSVDEYEKLRAAWAADGSPLVGGVAELVGGVTA